MQPGKLTPRNRPHSMCSLGYAGEGKQGSIDPARSGFPDMKLAYFDCFSGASGDMLLGALVDAGADLGRIETELRRVPLPDWGISAEKTKKKGISATKVHVHTGEQHSHRSLSEILRLVEDGRRAGLPAAVAD